MAISPPPGELSLTKLLCKKFTEGWPPWCGDPATTFKIRMEKANYDNFDVEDPEEQYALCQEFFVEIQNRMKTLDPEQETDLEEYLKLDMADMVYGSNYIENVGSDYNITSYICWKIFSGGSVEAEIDELDPEYVAGRAELIRRYLDSDRKSVLRSRREVIQHALALKHILTRLVVENGALSETLILETHAILFDGLDLDNETGRQESSAAAGEYGSQALQPDLSLFLHSIVPGAMAGRSLNQELADAREAGSLDPYYLAAKHCQIFVNFHPFLDGNGQMSRLILTALLLKYAGIVLSFGVKDSDRDEYLLRITAGSWQMVPEIVDEDDDEQEPIAEAEAPWSELATLVLRKAALKLRDIKERLSPDL